MKTLVLCLLCTSLVVIAWGSVLAQSEEKTFTSPKFGLSIKYPADWTFIQEEQDFTPEGSASLGDFCPTSAVGSNPKVLDCHMNLELNVPVYLSIRAFKLKDGTTLKDFYDQQVAEMKVSNDIVGRKNLETNDIKISGLPAIQTIGTIGGGDLDKLLEGIAEPNPKSKYMAVYVLNVNGGTGYKIWASIDDEQDYDKYIPTIQKMIDSFQLQGAILD
jgi:hypothetical protein